MKCSGSNLFRLLSAARGIMGFVAGGFSFFEYHGAILDFIQIITGICSSVSLVIMFADTMGRRQLGRIVENNVIML
ncbi:unnamed protein product [Adineta steineri]|uniref:Uncharacterized protein n=1 Tax=Adineta steineri TaxID=433720 RepID=A0A819S6T7_9BILA|nr:unnamed protein product [Adineta steineri]CAF4054547.1 unnamed protein product [Adineta steineri]